MSLAFIERNEKIDVANYMSKNHTFGTSSNLGQCSTSNKKGFLLRKYGVAPHSVRFTIAAYEELFKDF